VYLLDWFGFVFLRWFSFRVFLLKNSMSSSRTDRMSSFSSGDVLNGDVFLTAKNLSLFRTSFFSLSQVHRNSRGEW